MAKNLPISPILVLAMALWFTPCHGQVDPVPGVEPLIVSQDHAWPPFAFEDREGNPRGVLVELWQEIGLRLGRPVEFRLVDWPESIAQVRDGRAQVHGGLIPSPERSGFFDFSTELMPLETFMFVHSGFMAMNLADLHDTTVGVTEGSFEAEFMVREHPDMSLRYFPNNEHMIQAAVGGEIRAFVADYPVALYLLDRHATPADFRALQRLYRQPLVAAVPPGDAELLQAIDTVLAGFDEEELRRLQQRWLRSEKVEVLPVWVLPATAAVLIIALLALFSLMMYRQRCRLVREVAERTADLRASEAKFRVLFESAAVSVMVHDRYTCEVIDANKRALESYGVADKSSLHEMDIWAEPPYSFADVQRWFSRVRQEGPQRFEWMSRSVTGEVFWEDVSLQEVALRGVTRIVSTSVDITERKELEDKLRASEEKFRAIVENANDIIYSVSTSGILTYVSPNWAEKLGHDIHEVIGQPFDPFVHPDDLSKCYEFIRLVLDTKVKHGGIEYRVRHKDGGWHWHVTNASPVLDAEGEVAYFIGIARDITERKELEERMMRMAHYDPLTNLPNRILFSDRAEQAVNLAKRSGSRMAFMLLDLDKFKPVNDEYGHAVGDLLLQEAAQRMKACLRASDTVGRIGGDEFVVLLPVIEREQDALQVAEKIREALVRPFRIGGRVLTISCSVGIALYPEHGDSVIELSKHADYAMYFVKKQGRNACLIFQDEMLDDGWQERDTTRLE
ncbi:MAG: diguanylate cyclase [Xanthomonadaceae bacterium]|nr:diguanylate cyclase [Xanthomonadaceae bacterium]